MEKLKDIYKSESKALWIEEHFPLLDVLPDRKTITTKEGRVVQLLRLDGMDYTGRSYSTIDELARQRQSFFENIPEDISVSVHYQRRKFKHKVGKAYTDNVYANHIIEQRGKAFGTTYKTYIYIVVSKITQPFLGKFGVESKDMAAEEAKLTQDGKILSEAVRQLSAALKDYKPKTITLDQEDDKELLGFWSYLINGGDDNVVIPKKSFGLNNILSCTDIEFKGRTSKNILSSLGSFLKVKKVSDDVVKEAQKYMGRLLNEGNHQYCVFHRNSDIGYAAFISIKDFPDKTTANLLEGLMSVKAKFNVVQNVKPVDIHKAQARLEKMKHNAKELSKYVENSLGDINTCLEYLNDGSHKLLEHDLMICVYGDTVDELESSVSEILNAFIPVQIVGLREKSHIPAAFWGMFPDNEALNMPRKYMISTVSAGDFINFATKGEGNLTCAFGDQPVDFFKTPDGQAYAFTFHPTSDKTKAGHTLVLGGTGRGKTVLMNHLNTCCQKYKNMKTLVIDSFQGMNITVEALDGIYNNLDSLKMNPFMLPDNIRNRSFLENFMSILAGDANEIEKQTIAEAVELNFTSFEESERSLHAVRSHLGVPKTDPDKGMNLCKRLQKWMPDNHNAETSHYKHGQMFNADSDSLSFDKPVVGFDFTSLLDDKELKTPVSMYVFHAFQEAINKDPSPHVCFWDETLKFIEDDDMYKFMRTALLEWRKRNGVFVGAVQSPNLLVNLGKKGQDFLNSFETYIIFPDPQAEPNVYIGDKEFGGIGITDSEFEWIKNTTSRYQVMIKRKEGSSTIIDVNLSGLDEHLVLLRSEQELVRSFEKTKELHPDDWPEILMQKHGEKSS